jgi:DNA polymerase I-like protein with 3'-5' exonuclease and polymerase domains
VPRLKRLNFEALATVAYNRWAVDQPEIMAVDTETEGVGFFDPAFCVTVAWRNDSGVCRVSKTRTCVCPNGACHIQSHYFERGYGGMLPSMLDKTPMLVFHNAKFDLQKLILAGVLERDRLSGDRFEDTETLAYLSNEHWDKHLKVLARDLLGLQTDEAKVVRKAREQVKKELGIRYIDDVGFHMIPRTVIYPYAKKDAEFTLLLYELLRGRIAAFQELENLYHSEKELALAVLDIEAAGMGVRLDYVDEKIKEYNRRVLEQELIISDITGKKVWYPERKGQKTPEGCYNPNSWQQVAEVIGTKKTDVKTLATLAHPLAAATVKLRQDKKTLNTYLRAIKAEQRNGVLHPWFNISRVVTGRFSSSKADEGG